MNRRFRALPVLAVLLALLPFVLAGCSVLFPKGTLQLTLAGPGNAPEEGAVVRVLRDGKTVAEGIADAAGTVSIEVRTGTYQVEAVSSDGLRTARLRSIDVRKDAASTGILVLK